MKKILITFITIIMTIAVNTAQADVAATTRYILDTVPVPVTVAEAHRCAAAYHHGGMYRLMSAEVTLTCRKHTIRKEWDPSN